MQIGDEITLNVVTFKGKNVFRAEFVNSDYERSIRIFSMKTFAPIKEGEEWRCRIVNITVSNQMTKDGRSKVFISVEPLKRVEKKKVSINGNEAFVTVKSGNRLLSSEIVPVNVVIKKIKDNGYVYTKKDTVSKSSDEVLTSSIVDVVPINTYLKELVSMGISHLSAHKVINLMGAA